MRIAVTVFAVLSLSVLAGCPIENIPVDFSLDTSGGNVPLTVTFTNTTDTRYLRIKAYHWDFGDGGTSTEASPTHVYSTPGRYTVSLKLDTNRGEGLAIKTNCVVVVGQFHVQVLNSGDFPISGVFFVSASAQDWGSNRILAPIAPDDMIDLGRTFQQGQYLVAVVFNVNGTTEDVMLSGNLDTIGMAQGGYVTIDAFRNQDGSIGISAAPAE